MSDGNNDGKVNDGQDEAQASPEALRHSYPVRLPEIECVYTSKLRLLHDEDDEERCQPGQRVWIVMEDNGADIDLDSTPKKLNEHYVLLATDAEKSDDLWRQIYAIGTPMIVGAGIVTGVTYQDPRLGGNVLHVTWHGHSPLLNAYDVNEHVDLDL